MGERKLRRTYDEPGHARFLTFSCFHRRQYLAADRSKDVFLEHLDASRARLEFEIWAFVVMPEHVHLLINPSDASVAQILQSIKQPSSRRLRKLIGCGTPFWQAGGGYDRNIWSQRAIEVTVDYIHENPVRRKLCTASIDYPWSSAAADEGFDSRINVDSWRA
jgi:putative transposase